jgi:Flp pilus assembly pilin Flp
MDIVMDSNLSMNKIKSQLRQFWNDEEGMGTLEILLIIAVIVIIAIAFRKWILKWVGELFKKADAEISSQNLDGTSISPPEASP